MKPALRIPTLLLLATVLAACDRGPSAEDTAKAARASAEQRAYENQVKECDAEVAKRKKETEDEASRAEKAKAAWEEKRVAFAKKTFDARASPYVEF